jgi:hypothetical protein
MPRHRTPAETGLWRKERRPQLVSLTHAFRVWQIECLKQIFIPAECVRHLRWKQEWLRRNGGGSPETALAIARDEAALAGRLEIVGRQQAGRKANRKAVLS